MVALLDANRITTMLSWNPVEYDFCANLTSMQISTAVKDSISVAASDVMVLTTQSWRLVFSENTPSWQLPINTHFQQIPLLRHIIFWQSKLILQHRNHPFFCRTRSDYGVNFTPVFGTVSTPYIPYGIYKTAGLIRYQFSHSIFRLLSDGQT